MAKNLGSMRGLADYVSTAHVCSHCEVVSEITHRQMCTSEGVRYAASFSCPGCTHAFEADGFETPDDARALLFEQSGRWTLILRNAGEDMIQLVRILSSRFSITLPAALKLAKAVPYEVMIGTRVETHCLAEAFERVGAQIELVRLDSPKLAATEP